MSDEYNASSIKVLTKFETEDRFIHAGLQGNRVGSLWEYL